jgi:hypothetical protein
MVSPQMVFRILQLVQEHRQAVSPQAIVLPLVNLQQAFPYPYGRGAGQSGNGNGNGNWV